MNKYVKRIVTAIVCFLFVVVFNFILPRLLPGDPVAYLTGSNEDAMTSTQYEYYRNVLHLNENIFVQFWFYLKDVFSFSLGYSYKQEMGVMELISIKIKPTLLICLPAVVLSSMIGLVLGLYSGYHKGTKRDKITGTFEILLSTLPTFLIAFILIIIFGINGNLPYRGLNSIGVTKESSNYVADTILHMVLPVLTLVLAITPSRYLLMRNTTSKEMSKKYVLFAKERGINATKIRYKYILPNIIAPFIVMMGMSVGICIGGSVIVETIFSIDGMGRCLTNATSNLDYPLIQGILFLISFIMMISIIVTDILCLLIDPKERRKSNES